MTDPRLIHLLDLLHEAFNLGDLDEFCTRLGVDYEDLAGDDKPAKARSLIKYLQHRKRLDDLIRIGREQRPELDWPDTKIPVASTRRGDAHAAPRTAATPAPPADTTAAPPMSEPTTPVTPAIYISYALGEPGEGIVDELDSHFQSKGIQIIRDRRNLGYKGRIKEFMAKIGRGRYVIVVISEKYLKSENCMFELLEIARHGELHRCIFPIVLEDADIYNAIDRIRYVKYWEERIAELDAAMKQVGSANLQGFRDDIDLYTRIRDEVAGLTDTLRDMLNLTPAMHRGSDFEILYQAIETAIKQDRQ